MKVELTEFLHQFSVSYIIQVFWTDHQPGDLVMLTEFPSKPAGGFLCSNREWLNNI